MGIRDAIARISEEISKAVFPSNIYCIVCGSLIDGSRPYALCDKCVQEMHWITGGTCDWCGKALPDTYRGVAADGRRLCYDCMERAHFFTRGWSCLSYGLHEREIMMDIKYNSKGYIARKMGDVLFDRMEPLIEAAFSDGLVPFDIVVPVPVSRKRLLKRGYNQSELMAQQFVKRWKQHLRAVDAVAAEAIREADAVGVTGAGVTRSADEFVPLLETKVLVRQKETTMLRSLNPAERRLALIGAFAVVPRLRDRIEGKNILLVDDIYTTGATADACSKVLLEEGAEAVYLLSLCSGGNRRPKDE